MRHNIVMNIPKTLDFYFQSEAERLHALKVSNNDELLHRLINGMLNYADAFWYVPEVCREIRRRMESK
jgi:hypothetical protein